MNELFDYPEDAEEKWVEIAVLTEDSEEELERKEWTDKYSLPYRQRKKKIWKDYIWYYGYRYYSRKKRRNVFKGYYFCSQCDME